MKKILSLLLLMTCLVSVGMAQTNTKKDPEAKKILDRSKAKFESFKSFKADFTQKMESTNTGMNESNKGSIKVKGDKFRVKMGDQEVIVNGSKTWTVLHDDCETNESSYDSEDEAVMKPSEIVNMYEKGYKYIYMGDQVIDGVACYSIDLEPDVTPEERGNTQVTKIRIYINKSTNIIKRWKIYERNGNKYTYSLDKFVPNVDISDSDFEYSKKICPCCELIKLD